MKFPKNIEPYKFTSASELEDHLAGMAADGGVAVAVKFDYFIDYDSIRTAMGFAGLKFEEFPNHLVLVLQLRQ